MARMWTVSGPDEDRLSFGKVAEMFGYEPGSLRRLITEGRFPPARGLGANQYYTGEDVAVITLMFGRWGPQTPPRPVRKGDREEAEDADG